MISFATFIASTFAESATEQCVVKAGQEAFNAYCSRYLNDEKTCTNVYHAYCEWKTPIASSQGECVVVPGFEPWGIYCDTTDKETCIIYNVYCEWKDTTDQQPSVGGECVVREGFEDFRQYCERYIDDEEMCYIYLDYCKWIEPETPPPTLSGGATARCMASLEHEAYQEWCDSHTPYGSVFCNNGTNKYCQWLQIPGVESLESTATP